MTNPDLTEGSGVLPSVQRRAMTTHRLVHVTLKFANGEQHSASWRTPINLGPAAHKAVTWTRQDASNQKIPGRSKVVGIYVDALDVPGAYSDEP